jgi:hypothetical protein
VLDELAFAFDDLAVGGGSIQSSTMAEAITWSRLIERWDRKERRRSKRLRAVDATDWRAGLMTLRISSEKPDSSGRCNSKRTASVEIGGSTGFRQDDRGSRQVSF